MEGGIVRTPTDDERRDFIPVVDPSKRDKNAKEKFDEELGNKMLEAQKKGLPFCDRAAKDDFNDYWKREVELNVRKNNYLKPEEIKPFKIDWGKYSDLKNFEVLEEKEVSDEYQSKRNPGLDVTMKTIVYRFKGYSNKYTVMEDVPSAVRRSRQRLKDLESDTTKKK